MPGRDRLGDRACFLALLTFLLLSPPILTLFGTGSRIFGVPLLIVYCFTIWLAAILAGRHISRNLGAAEYGNFSQPDDPDKPGGE
jgi:hypothetical protein